MIIVMRVTYNAVFSLMRVTTIALNTNRYDEETDPKRQTSNGYSGGDKR